MENVIGGIVALVLGLTIGLILLSIVTIFFQWLWNRNFPSLFRYFQMHAAGVSDSSRMSFRGTPAAQGMTTASITWITPLLVMISVLMTLALSTMTLPLLALIVRSRPFANR